MATTELKPIVLKGIATHEVTKMSGTFQYNKDTKMATDFPAGYHRYRYNGVVFTIPVDSDFHDDFKSGKVQAIKINQVADANDAEVIRYQFDSHINKAMFIEDAKFNAEIAAIEAGAGTTKVMSAEEAEELA